MKRVYRKWLFVFIVTEMDLLFKNNNPNLTNSERMRGIGEISLTQFNPTACYFNNNSNVISSTVFLIVARLEFVFATTIANNEKNQSFLRSSFVFFTFSSFSCSILLFFSLSFFILFSLQDCTLHAFHRPFNKRTDIKTD